MTVSKTLEIYPINIRRAVHIRNDGKRGRWNMNHNGTQIMVSGDVRGSVFLPDEKFIPLVKEYKPRRHSFKRNDRVIANKVQELNKSSPSIYITIGDVKRKVNRTGYGNGNVTYMGETIPVSINEETFEVSIRK